MYRQLCRRSICSICSACNRRVNNDCIVSNVTLVLNVSIVSDVSVVGNVGIVSSSVSNVIIVCNSKKCKHKGVARIFQRGGGGVTLDHTDRKTAK